MTREDPRHVVFCHAEFVGILPKACDALEEVAIRLNEMIVVCYFSFNGVTEHAHQLAFLGLVVQRMGSVEDLRRHSNVALSGGDK